MNGQQQVLFNKLCFRKSTKLLSLNCTFRFKLDLKKNHHMLFEIAFHKSKVIFNEMATISFENLLWFLNSLPEKILDIVPPHRAWSLLAKSAAEKKRKENIKKKKFIIQSCVHQISESEKYVKIKMTPWIKSCIVQKSYHTSRYIKTTKFSINIHVHISVKVKNNARFNRKLFFFHISLKLQTFTFLLKTHIRIAYVIFFFKFVKWKYIPVSKVLHKIEVFRILRCLCSGVADITLNVQSLSHLHCMLWAHTCQVQMYYALTFTILQVPHYFSQRISK